MVEAGVGFKFLIRLIMVGETGSSTLLSVLKINGGVGILVVVCRGTVLEKLWYGIVQGVEFLMFEMRGAEPVGGLVVERNRVDVRVWMERGDRADTRSRLSFCLRKEISLTKAASLCFSWSNSDLNSRRMSVMNVMGESSVFLFVAMVEPPREALSGIDTTSTGGGIEGYLT